MGQTQTWLWPLESPDPQGLSPHPVPLLQRQEVMEGTQQQSRGQEAPPSRWTDAGATGCLTGAPTRPPVSELSASTETQHWATQPCATWQGTQARVLQEHSGGEDGPPGLASRRPDTRAAGLQLTWGLAHRSWGLQPALGPQEAFLRGHASPGHCVPVRHLAQGSLLGPAKTWALWTPRVAPATPNTPGPALPLPTRQSIFVGPGRTCLAVSWSGRMDDKGWPSELGSPSLCSIPVGVGLPQLSSELRPQLPAPEGSLSLTLGELSSPVPNVARGLWDTGTSVSALALSLPCIPLVSLQFPE